MALIQRIIHDLLNVHPIHTLVEHFPIALTGSGLFFILLALWRSAHPERVRPDLLRRCDCGLGEWSGDRHRNPDSRSLLQMILQGKMPKSGPKLLPGQVQILTDWVKAGAPNN